MPVLGGEMGRFPAYMRNVRSVLAVGRGLLVEECEQKRPFRPRFLHGRELVLRKRPFLF